MLLKRWAGTDVALARMESRLDALAEVKAKKLAAKPWKAAGVSKSTW